MRILLLTLLCCLILSCGKPTEDTTNPTTTPPLSTQPDKPPAKQTSLLNRLEEDETSIDHEAKYTFTPPEDPDWITFGALRAPKPAGWAWVPPKTLDVTCNYTIPSTKNRDRGLFTILQYEEDESGTLAQHISRWKLLFRSNEGGPIIPDIKTRTFSSIDATMIEFHGEYMGAGGAWHLSKYSLLVVLLENDSITTHIKMTGPISTIDSNRDALHTLLSKIEKTDTESTTPDP